MNNSANYDMEKLMTWISDITGLSDHSYTRVIVSIIAILILWVIRTIVIRIVWHQTDNPVVRYRWRKTIGYAYMLVLVVVLVRIWFEATESVVYVFGLIAAGMTIALQDIIKSLAGWLFILWRRPFYVGDRIQIGEVKGDVIDVRPFKFSLVEIGNWVDADQSTGRVIHVANCKILTETIINYAEGFQFIWNEVPVLITFESNWRKAKDILQEIAVKNAEPITRNAEKRIREASKKYMIFYNNLTPIVYTSIKDCGVMLTIRYLIEPRRRRGSVQAIHEEILEEFSKHSDIDFAYPTQRFYDNKTEGKPGMISSFDLPSEASGNGISSN